MNEMYGSPNLNDPERIWIYANDMLLTGEDMCMIWVEPGALVRYVLFKVNLIQHNSFVYRFFYEWNRTESI